MTAVATFSHWLLFFVSVVVVWIHTAIGSAVISRERFKRELCVPGWLSSNIILVPTLSEDDRHLCMWDERIRRDSCQNFIRETPHSVTKSEQCRVSRPQFPWSFHGAPGTMTPLLATKTLARVKMADSRKESQTTILAEENQTSVAKENQTANAGKS